jgi:pimeloyl-ACP methyl ester carboxylesterase
VQSVRLFARMAAVMSPDFAGGFAARLFFATTRAPLRPDEAAVLDRARELGVPFRDHALRAWVWGEADSEATVLLVHGWSGRAGQMTALVDPLLARRARVVAFDLPSHGASPGRSSTIPEIAAGIEAVSDEFDGIDGIVAHSLGCLATTLALSRGLRAGRIAYVAPPLDPEQWVRRFGSLLGLSSLGLEAMRRAVEARVGLSTDELLHTRLADDMTSPLLVVHDDGDREVPPSDGSALASAWPGARLESTSGLGHNRILRNESVVARLAEFVVPSVG